MLHNNSIFCSTATNASKLFSAVFSSFVIAIAFESIDHDKFDTFSRPHNPGESAEISDLRPYWTRKKN